LDFEWGVRDEGAGKLSYMLIKKIISNGRDENTSTEKMK
jgi:hypothetical protein